MVDAVDLRGDMKIGRFTILPAYSMRCRLMQGDMKIGRFTITGFDAESVWISVDGGEGGQFRIDKLEEVIAKFYSDNF